MHTLVKVFDLLWVSEWFLEESQRILILTPKNWLAWSHRFLCIAHGLYARVLIILRSKGCTYALSHKYKPQYQNQKAVIYQYKITFWRHVYIVLLYWASKNSFCLSFSACYLWGGGESCQDLSPSHELGQTSRPWDSFWIICEGPERTNGPTCTEMFITAGLQSWFPASVKNYFSWWSQRGTRV